MKINKTLIVLTSLILLFNPILNITIKSTSESLTMFDSCFTMERSGTQAERANLKQFAKRVDTDIVKRSNHGICSGSDCRGWLEAKILAFCKANLLASKLEKKTFNLVNVLFKSESKGEYSQFLFSTETGQNLKTGSNEFNSKLLYRVCVPVDRKDNAYVDFKCPYSPCTNYESSKTCRNNDQYKHEKANYGTTGAEFVPVRKINDKYNR